MNPGFPFWNRKQVRVYTPQPRFWKSRLSAPDSAPSSRPAGREDSRPCADPRLRGGDAEGHNTAGRVSRGPLPQGGTGVTAKGGGVEWRNIKLNLIERTPPAGAPLHTEPWRGGFQRASQAASHNRCPHCGTARRFYGTVSRLRTPPPLFLPAFP